MREAEIERVLLDLAAARGPDKSFCPSEAARRIDPADWRAAMPAVHAAAERLARAGALVIMQGGRQVTPESARGAYRLGVRRPQ